MSQSHRGSCHCGRVTFTFVDGPIRGGKQCNCSICRRRNSVMSVPYYRPEDITIEGEEHLTRYTFGDYVWHWFCRHCGIYTFHDGPGDPGHYRVNLGCVEGVDLRALTIEWVDGASFPL